MKKIFFIFIVILTSVIISGCTPYRTEEVGTPDEFISALQRYTNSPRHKDTPENIILTADIDLAGYEWPTDLICGHIYGQGHTIKNITIDVSEGNYVGMFKSINSLKNVNIENLQMTYYGKGGIVGGICSRGTFSIDNVKISGSIYAPSAKMVGGIIGSTDIGYSNKKEAITINNVQMDMKVTGGNYVGGIIGEVDGKLNLKNVVNKGEITSKANVYFDNEIYDSESYAGGLVGKIDSGGRIENCKNFGTVISNKYAGGIAGEAIISNCINSSNEGNIIINKTEIDCTYAGGIAGVLKTTEINSNLSNSGNVQAMGLNGYAGGIASYVEGGAEFVNCSNSGKISSHFHLGGLAGICLDEVQFIQCNNSGIVDGEGQADCVGGIIGHSINSFVNLCTNSGSVEGGMMVGGIVGEYVLYYYDQENKYIETDKEGAIVNSSNSGNVSAGTRESDYAAGIIGKLAEFNMTGFDTNTNSGEIIGTHVDQIANIVESE